MLNFNPNSTAIHQLTTGQTIPYWLYLRVIHLSAISPFGPEGSLTNAFITSTLRGEGYDVSDTILNTLANEPLQLEPHERTQLQALRLHQMRPQYDKIFWAHLRHQMQAITPRLMVSMSDLSMDIRPLTIGHQADITRSDTDAVEARAAHDDVPSHLEEDIDFADHSPGAEFADNFDLSCTSSLITEDNYKSFMRSPLATPTLPRDTTADAEPANHVPAYMWPRAPPLGQPHIDAFSGLELKTVHKPVYNPVGRFHRWNDDDMETPLLAEYTIGTDYVHPSTIKTFDIGRQGVLNGMCSPGGPNYTSGESLKIV